MITCDIVMKSNMKNKKTPASTSKKRNLPAASSRSRRKAARELTRGTQSNDGSYLLSDANMTSDTPAMPSTATTHSSTEVSNQTLMAFLQKLDDSNKQIMCRIDDLEKQNTVNSTPLQSPSAGACLAIIDDRPTIHEPNPWDRVDHVDPVNPRELFTDQPLSTSHDLPGRHRAQRQTLAHPGFDNSSDRMSHARFPNSGLYNLANPHLNHVASRSADDPTVRHPPIPSLEALRMMPTVNDAVTQLLSHYEQGNGQELIQGKSAPKRSGRYNNTDTSALQPQFRWPNEGFTGGATKKRTAYDDLSVPQWVAGQLTNAIQIQDNDILRSVLTQIIFTMRDAASIPWPAVREAYASSMHEVEEGRLAWSNATQWALNRLSAYKIGIWRTGDSIIELSSIIGNSISVKFIPSKINKTSSLHSKYGRWLKVYKIHALDKGVHIFFLILSHCMCNCKRN